MRTIILLSFLSAPFLFLESCANNRAGKGDDSRTLPACGIIHQSIQCQADTSLSYSLYIPAGGQEEPVATAVQQGRKAYPVVIAFDPHGDGALPLTLYQRLADRFGFLMIGSNDSRNGLPGERIRTIVEALAREVRSVYPVDTTMIYLLGFSGGARVATMAGLHYIPVTGVTGCGAGFGGTDQPTSYRFNYFGLVGTADFNMDELLSLDQPLANAGIRHFIATFPGKHEWPPVPVMEDAFCWHFLNAVRDGKKEKDTLLLAEIAKKFRGRADSLLSSSQFIRAAECCREAISMLDGLYVTGWFDEELWKIGMNSGYQSQLEYRKLIIDNEAKEKKMLVDAIQSKDLNWWKAKIGSYRSGMAGEFNRAGHPAKVNPEDTLKNQRLLSFLSLVCYMNATAAIQKNDLLLSEKILNIYEMADPPNPEPNYLRAVILAGRSAGRESLKQLMIAAQKGFNDKARMVSQPEFNPFHGMTGWVEVMQSIK